MQVPIFYLKRFGHSRWKKTWVYVKKLSSFWLHEYRGVGVDGIGENRSDFLYLFTVPHFHHIMVDPRSAWRFIEVMDIWPPLIGMLLGSIQGQD